MSLRSNSIVFVAGMAALAACSTGGNAGNTTNPLAGVTIINAPPASASPSASPSPTPAPGATQVIADSGFESGGFSAGWTACSIPHVAPSSTASPGAVAAPPLGADVVSASSPPFAVASGSPDQMPEIHSGTYSAFTFSGTGAQTTAPYGSAAAPAGGAGTNGVCQTFTVPANAMLTMYVWEGGSDSGLKYADQQSDIIGSSGTDTNLFYEFNAPSNSASTGTYGAWVEKGPYALTAAPYSLAAGSSVNLFIGSYDSSPEAQYGAFMFVDDVTVTGTTTASALRRRSVGRTP